MATQHSRENISMPLLQIKYIKCTERIPGTLVAILGFLISLWTNCVIVALCYPNENYYTYHENYISKQIVLTSQITHLIIVLTITAGLFLGLKEKNRSLLPPFLALKLLEVGALFIGIVLIVFGYTDYVGLLPIALIFLLIGLYISLCIWDTYSKMALITNASEDNVSLDIDDENVLPKDPPSYDSFINEANSRN